MIAASEASVPWHPASLTKIMTVHLALRAVERGFLSMDTPVVMSAHAAAMPPSKLGLPAGKSIPLRDAIAAMLVRSTNDVAVAIAETVSGTEPAFAAEMNFEARRIGMTATRFVNASGLHDPRQVTTARDVGVLALAVLREHPQHRHLFSLKSVPVAGKVLTTTNHLIGSYPGASGMKTGYICPSGFNIVAMATREGRNVIAVVLGEGSGKARTATARRLLDIGFSTEAEGPAIASYAVAGLKPAQDMRPLGCGRNRKANPLTVFQAGYGGAPEEGAATGSDAPPRRF